MWHGWLFPGVRRCLPFPRVLRRRLLERMKGWWVEVESLHSVSLLLLPRLPERFVPSFLPLGWEQVDLADVPNPTMAHTAEKEEEQVPWKNREKKKKTDDWRSMPEGERKGREEQERRERVKGGSRRYDASSTRMRPLHHRQRHLIVPCIVVSTTVVRVHSHSIASVAGEVAQEGTRKRGKGVVVADLEEGRECGIETPVPTPFWERYCCVFAAGTSLLHGWWGGPGLFLRWGLERGHSSGWGVCCRLLCLLLLAPLPSLSRILRYASSPLSSLLRHPRAVFYRSVWDALRYGVAHRCGTPHLAQDWSPAVEKKDACRDR